MQKKITINGKYEDRRNKKTTKKPIWKINERFKCLFYLVEKINRNLLNKAQKSDYGKNKVFYKLCNKIENRDTIFDEEDEEIPFRAPFIEQKKDIDQSSTLYRIKAPFELFHADIANIKFLSKSPVDPHYCLLCADLFSPKIYTYPMKKRSLLAKKIKQFYEEIERKGDSKEQMRIQTDLEFRQREIQKLNKKYNVLIFRTKIRRGKAFAAKQNIREFKTILQKSKRMHKSTSTKRIEPKKLIQRATNNLNSTASQKYGVSPNFVEENTQQDEKFCEIYDFHRLVKVQKHAKRYKRNDIRQDDKKRKKLREPLVVGEKVFVLAERLKTKDAPGVFYKSTTKNKPFLTKTRYFLLEELLVSTMLIITGFQKQLTVK